MVKWVLIIIGVAAVVGGIVWYAANDHEDAPVYTTTTIARGDITQTVSASGQLNPVLNVQVGSQISGNIQKLYADFNSLVKSNQIVAQLDPAIFQASVHQAEGDLANARAGFELAELNAKRSAELLNSKLIPQADFDKATADLHQAQAMVRIKEASLERAKVDLGHCTIYAPVDGIVISRSVDVGQTVAASMNAPTLFIIANDLSKMQIDANVSEADVGAIEEGQAATFTVDAFPNRNFVGKVVQIRNAPITVQNVVTYDTVIGVDNPDQKLKPGMTATVSITTAQRHGVLRVPNAALRFKPPEAPTNQTALAHLLGKLGLGKDSKNSQTNTAKLASASGTNKVEVADAGSAPLTGNEPPEELMKRVREMRERGEDIPENVRTKIRELFQSGALQRPGGGGGGGGPGMGGPSGARPRNAQPSARTVYAFASKTPTSQDEPPKLQPIRVRTGISDGAYTEVTDGLKEGDSIITAVKLPQSATVAAPAGGSSPFGGGGGGRRGF
jgi:HlyD family secretion protein